jgi:hypothetical protein
VVGGVEAEGGPAAPAAAGIAGVAAWPRRGCCERKRGDSRTDPVVSAPGATEGATGGGENWAELEGHEPEAVERRAVQPLESPLRQPERSPAATNAVGGQNCGRMWAGGTCKKYMINLLAMLCRD